MTGGTIGRPARPGGAAGYGAIVLLAAAAIAAIVIGWGPGIAGHVVARHAGGAAGAETLFTLLVFGPLLLVGIGGRAAAGIPARTGLDVPGAIGPGIAIGLGGILAAIGFAAIAGVVRPGPAPSAPVAMLAWGMVVVAFQAAAEEFYFRGWLQTALARDWGPMPALGTSAIVFAGVHILGGERAPLSLLNLVLGGLVFGMLAMRAGGLGAAIGAHFAWNATEQIGFGLDPNPGTGGFGAFADRDLIGNALWGGSAEGLNASLAMTIALLAILAPLVIARRDRR